MRLPASLRRMVTERGGIFTMSKTLGGELLGGARVPRDFRKAGRDLKICHSF